MARSGADLRVLRERTGASIEWLAHAAGVTERSVGRWERDEPGGRWHVPVDVWDVLQAVADRQAEIADEAINMISETGASVVLLAYRDQDDFDSGGNPDGWTVAMQRAMLGLIQEACEVRIVWFERVLYDAWRAVHASDRLDTSALRSMWAATT